MKKIMILLSATAFIAGCSTEWSRPGATEAEFYQDRYQCQQESSGMYPAMMVQTTMGSGYTSPSQTNCYTYGSSTNCSTTPGTYHPPAVITQDSNLGNRNSAFKSCLFAKGYESKMKFLK